MEPKNSADNSAPSMPKQDEPQDVAAQAQPSQEVSVDITDGQSSAADTTNTSSRNSDLDSTSFDSETSAGIGSAAAGGAVGDMPSLTSEAPTDQVASLPSDPAEGAPTPGAPGQSGSTDRLGATGDPTLTELDITPAPSDAPGPQAPLAPVTDQPDPSPNTMPPVAPVPAPSGHNSKKMLILVGAGVFVIVVIALIFLI